MNNAHLHEGTEFVALGKDIHAALHEMLLTGDELRPEDHIDEQIRQHALDFVAEAHDEHDAGLEDHYFDQATPEEIRGHLERYAARIEK
jgi:hypothetical protein